MDAQFAVPEATATFTAAGIGRDQPMRSMALVQPQDQSYLEITFESDPGHYGAEPTLGFHGPSYDFSLAQYLTEDRVTALYQLDRGDFPPGLPVDQELRVFVHAQTTDVEHPLLKSTRYPLASTQGPDPGLRVNVNGDEIDFLSTFELALEGLLLTLVAPEGMHDADGNTVMVTIRCQAK
ncbi:hypothetical protein BC828DRAFT_400859 [Blastocladiella britannica]|nr:hypothetical protein BC828DRAFT_400859 [Blastocladiella britannica]